MLDQLALNHITCPSLDIEACALFAKKIGISAIEIRNDLSDRPIKDYLPDPEVIERLESHNIKIISINALQEFNRNDQLDRKVAELETLITTAALCGCSGIVLCPVCSENDSRSREQSLSDTVAALNTYGKLFQESNICGFVEPLGFERSSLRFKQDAINAIAGCGYSQVYQLVHDTFHHYLSGEKNLFPEHTAIVHVSGVEEDLPRSRLTDDHRKLVTKDDIMGNRQQVRQLREQGCNGPVSYECFSKEIQALTENELAEALTRSMHYLFP